MVSSAPLNGGSGAGLTVLLMIFPGEFVETESLRAAAK
jgi:hypothetical protein